MLLPINFYRTRIKEPVIITRVKSSSNYFFLFVFCVVSCWLHASGAFFACCHTCNVLILSQIVSARSMSSEIHHLQLKFVFFLRIFLTVDEHLENPTKINLSRFGEFQKRLPCAYDLYFILSPQIRQSEVRCWTWISIRLIKLFWPWKEKRQRLVLMRKK